MNRWLVTNDTDDKAAEPRERTFFFFIGAAPTIVEDQHRFHCCREARARIDIFSCDNRQQNQFCTLKALSRRGSGDGLSSPGSYRALFDKCDRQGRHHHGEVGWVLQSRFVCVIILVQTNTVHTIRLHKTTHHLCTCLFHSVHSYLNY